MILPFHFHILNKKCLFKEIKIHIRNDFIPQQFLVI